VIIGKLFINIRTRATTVIGMFFFIIILILNGGSLGYISLKYSHSTYQGDMKWYKSQLQEIEKAPPLIRDWTKQGVKVFVSLFNQVQRLNR
jgi:hypothetical protein